MILSIEDKEKREKLNKFARQALDRAEELKGIKKTEDSPSEDPLKTIGVQKSSALVSPTTVTASVRNPSIPTHSPKLEVVSRDGYTMEEKKVLEKTSLINSRIFVPFMDSDAKEKFNFPIPFTDKDGLLELAPKQKREFQQWLRISELSEDPNIILGNHPDFYAIKQTVSIYLMIKICVINIFVPGCLRLFLCLFAHSCSTL